MPSPRRTRPRPAVGPVDPAPAQVDELQAFIERVVTGPAGYTATASTATVTSSTPAPLSATQIQEYAMRTQARDQLCEHLEALAGIASRSAASLRAREARNINAQVLEATVTDIVARVDAAFIVTNPAMADAE